eukprot:1146005-Pyramimonas_sp.AAC.1
MGSRAAVGKAVIKGATIIRDQVQQAGLRLAPKSVTLCDNMSDSKHVTRVLRKRGVDSQVVSQVSYLGVELGGGRRVARASRRQRTPKATACNKNVRRHAFAPKSYEAMKNIEFAGPQSAATYAHHVHGTFGWRLQQLRQQLGSVSGTHQRGRCLKTLLDVRAAGSS